MLLPTLRTKVTSGLVFSPASTGAIMEPSSRPHKADGAGDGSRALSSKGLQTRQAIEDAARKLFAERGFHGTTLVDITSAAGRSPAVFYRYYNDKEDLLAALADSFLHDVVLPSGLRLHLAESPTTRDFSSPSSPPTGTCSNRASGSWWRWISWPPPSPASPACRISSASSVLISSRPQCCAPRNTDTRWVAT